MEVFSWVESPGTQVVIEPRYGRTQFGDGYMERAPAGLNPITQRWQVQFRAIDTGPADAIDAFFRARVNAISGLEAFEWWPLWAAGPIAVICTAWTRTQDDEVDTSTIVATFEQVHEP